jgi:L-fuculose-phosphate aldolase
LHAIILGARPEIGCVVHAHPPAASALASARREIPPFHYMVAAAGGASIRCTPYVAINTRALGEAALAAMEGGRRACLLGNHGLVACADTPAAAVTLAEEVEWLAGTYLRALALG